MRESRPYGSVRGARSNARPYRDRRDLKATLAETRLPIPMKPGRPARCDYEYERNGVANLFMMFAPLEGWRHVQVTDRHTAVDYAHVLKDLADAHFAAAKVIVLVQDNLSIHSKASLYEAFPAAEARRLVERFEWRYTPKHGSWLNLAESELGVLSSQCLDRRIPEKQVLVEEVAAGTAMPITPRPIGASQPQTLASNSSTYTRQSDWNRATSARTGDRNARDSIIRIERSLLPSRTASDSMLWVGSDRSSSSQR